MRDERAQLDQCHERHKKAEDELEQLEDKCAASIKDAHADVARLVRELNALHARTSATKHKPTAVRAHNTPVSTTAIGADGSNEATAARVPLPADERPPMTDEERKNALLEGVYDSDFFEELMSAPELGPDGEYVYVHELFE